MIWSGITATACEIQRTTASIDVTLIATSGPIAAASNEPHGVGLARFRSWITWGAWDFRGARGRRAEGFFVVVRGMGPVSAARSAENLEDVDLPAVGRRLG